ncbi:MAG: hypothetical protein ACJA08_002137 [Cyclobacteriaceae bacterium]|jgi:hypothetical protein
MRDAYKLLPFLIMSLGCSVNKYQLAGEDKDFLIEQIESLSARDQISKKPILVIDGVEYVKKKDIALQKINLSKDRIEEIELLKKEAAIRVFGEEGKRGVLIITTKSN